MSTSADEETEDIVSEDVTAEATDDEDVETESEVEVEAEVTPAPEEGEKKEEGYTAYVVNISYDTQNWQLRELFSSYGTVSRVFMPQDRNTGKAKGIAFVTMSTAEELENAIAELNESQVDGRTMYVDKAKPKGSAKPTPKEKKENETKLYVGNLSYETTTEDLQEFFSQYGEVSDVYIPYDRDTGSSRGFGFLSMATEAANTAIEQANGYELQGRQIQVNESLPKGQQAPRRGGGGVKTDEVKIYVGNVPFDTPEESVVELFNDYGPVIDFYMPIDRNFGRPRGFAFVTLPADSASTAIEELDGIELDGRFLRVNEAQPKGSFSEPRNDYNNNDGGYYNNDDGWGSEDGY